MGRLLDARLEVHPVGPPLALAASELFSFQTQEKKNMELKGMRRVVPGITSKRSV